MPTSSGGMTPRAPAGSPKHAGRILRLAPPCEKLVRRSGAGLAALGGGREWGRVGRAGVSGFCDRSAEAGEVDSLSVSVQASSASATTARTHAVRARPGTRVPGSALLAEVAGEASSARAARNAASDPRRPGSNRQPVPSRPTCRRSGSQTGTLERTASMTTFAPPSIRLGWTRARARRSCAASPVRPEPAVPSMQPSLAPRRRLQVGAAPT